MELHECQNQWSGVWAHFSSLNMHDIPANQRVANKWTLCLLKFLREKFACVITKFYDWKVGVNQIDPGYWKGIQSVRRSQKQGSSPRNLPTMPKYWSTPLLLVLIQNNKIIPIHLDSLLHTFCICGFQLRLESILTPNNNIVLHSSIFYDVFQCWHCLLFCVC